VLLVAHLDEDMVGVGAVEQDVGDVRERRVEPIVVATTQSLGGAQRPARIGPDRRRPWPPIDQIVPRS
jgi:hypothetical protein